MQTLIVIDVQKEFSAEGKRPVPDHLNVVGVIRHRVEKARQEGTPIAWVRHFNRPTESPAFVPGTWGSEFVDGLGPKPGAALEKEFHKVVYGAFTGTGIGDWLKSIHSDEVLITGFYTHGCVSTTAREAIMADLTVYLDPYGTGSCDMEHNLLGRQSADENRRSALLQLLSMGALLSPALL